MLLEHQDVVSFHPDHVIPGSAGREVIESLLFHFSANKSKKAERPNLIVLAAVLAGSQMALLSGHVVQRLRLRRIGGALLKLEGYGHLSLSS